jgi:hypothetical protein
MAMLRGIFVAGCLALAGLNASCAPAQPAAGPLGGNVPEGDASRRSGAASARTYVRMVFRIASPPETWPRIAKVIPAEGDMQALLALDVMSLYAILVGADLASFVDASGPVELAVVKDVADDAMPALSLPIARFDEAVRELEGAFSVMRSGSGRFELTPQSGSGTLFEGGGVCELWQAANVHSGRLICSKTRSAIEGVGHDATSGTERQTTNQIDLWISDRMMQEAFKETTAQFSAGSPEEKLGQQLGTEFFTTSQDLRLGFNLAGDDVELSVSMAYPNPPAELPRVILGYREAQRAPKAFLSLPDRALLAFTTRGAPASAYTSFKKKAWPVIFAGLSDEDWDASGTAEFMRAVDKLLFTGGPVSMAVGLDVRAAKSQIASYLASESASPQAEAALQNSLSSWMIAAAPEPVERWAQGIRELTALDAKYSKLEELDASGNAATPSQSQRAPAPRKVRGAASTQYGTYTSEVAPEKIAGVGSPAVHFVFKSVPNVAFQPPAPDLLPSVETESHLLLVEIHEHAFACISHDAALCIKMLSDAAGAGAGTLGASPVAAQLRSQNAAVIGITTPVGFTALTEETSRRSQLAEYLNTLHDAEALPGGGTRPILFSGGAEPASGSLAGRFTLRTRLTLSDLIAWFEAVAD